MEGSSEVGGTAGGRRCHVSEAMESQRDALAEGLRWREGRGRRKLPLSSKPAGPLPVWEARRAG